MLEGIHLPLILGASLLATGTPGPATLAIAGASMNSGRKFGLALAAGVSTGSLMWSSAAAFGLGALMQANAWVMEIMRYLGAAYLLYLAWKSARSATRRGQAHVTEGRYVSCQRAYLKGLMLHLTNPKAILFFGSLYAVGIPAQASASSLAIIVGALALQSTLVFHGYALLFSSAPMIRGYMRLRRVFEAVFSLAFATAGVKILMSKAQ